ncbi:MAG: hypoxanthine phosphoribosyltransferase [Coriobacteriales bacterium]|nr:hypoxanthine phosphoribosyltransferase [Coriobacteriales bacterium]
MKGAEIETQDDIKQVLYSAEEICAAVTKMGEQITRDYSGRKVLLVTVLKGAFVFLADLARQIKGDVEVDFMAVSSYGAEASSSGVVRIIKDLQAPVDGRDVIIVEDILDSGLTLKYLLKIINARGPKSIEVATLLYKQCLQQARIEPRYVGFICPDEFVVGYGLDYAEKYRNLPYIGVLNEKVYK